MLRKILTIAVLAGMALEANAALLSGDMAFTAFNADEDGWALTTFKTIDANTTIYFSDNEWDGAAFNTGEGFHTWNSGESAISAGSIIRFSKVDQPIRSVSIGTYAANGDTGINATSETIYAYTGTAANAPTTFLAGISTEGSTNLTPAGLTNALNALVLTNSADFGQYTGDRSGQLNFSGYQALVNNAANWAIVVGGDQALQVPNTDSFSVAAVPVPAAVWLFSTALAGFGVINRRNNSQRSN
ncbi:MAG: hypothetical protein ABL925_08465 [Methylococcales bacterium]